MFGIGVGTAGEVVVGVTLELAVEEVPGGVSVELVRDTLLVG